MTAVAPGTGARPVWLANFGGALAALLLLKLGLVFNHIWGTEGVEPPARTLAKAMMFFGSDVLSAALLATVVLALWWPVRGRRAARFWVSLPLQAGHGLLASFSTFCIVSLGGPLNKQFIGISLMMLENWTPQMAASSSDYADTFAISLLVGGTLAAVVATTLLLRRSDALLGERARRWALRILVAEGVLTMAVVPFMTAGQIGFRVTSHGLEKSPAIELAWSYLRPPLRRAFAGDIGTGNEGFRYDLRSELAPPGAVVTTPFVGITPAKTNVLVVLMESIGDVYVDDDADPMPYYRSLRERPDAVVFGDHYATWSLTTKVFFSLLCSELPYPSYESISFVNPAIPCASITEVLHDDGYFTALVTASDLEFDRKKRFLRHRQLDLVWDAKTLPGAEGAWWGPWGLEDRIAMDGVLEAAQRAGDKPFFIIFNQLAGHHPFIATEEQANNPSPTRVENYMRSLRVADDVTRGAIEGLDKLGLLEDTLVVVVSDHGEGHGRLAGRNAYQPVVKVPGLMFGPQTRGRGGRIEATTSQLDMAPTILGLLGLPVPCTMKGRDLTRVAPPQIAIFGGRPPKFQIGLADGRWNYILEDGTLDMLFDVREDPSETTNLADEHPELTRAYRRRIESWSHQSAELIENYTEKMAAAGCRP